MKILPVMNIVYNVVIIDIPRWLHGLFLLPDLKIGHIIDCDHDLGNIPVISILLDTMWIIGRMSVIVCL